MTFNPNKYKTAKDAAKAFHNFLAAKYGKEEVFIYSPKKTIKMLGAKNYACWWVTHEGGEFDWAIPASFKIAGATWHTEPYYGFDLMFFDD